jgi:hypothetical protein
MLRGVDLLRGQVEQLLQDSGFPEDLYFLKIEASTVVVMFDEKEAVDYFEGDFDDSELAINHTFEKERRGVRYCAIIY